MNKRRRKPKKFASRLHRKLGNKHLKLEALEARQLLAANVFNDSLTLASDSSINVLTNDTSGSEVQTVSAFQVDFDRSTYDPGVNATDFFIPDRPGQPGVPQRSLIPGAVTTISGNRGDLDLYRDTDNDPSNDTDLPRLTADEGISLPVLRDNQPVDGSGTNLGVLQYVVDAASTWIAMAAAPENSGESSVPISNTFFPYDAQWIGGTFDESGTRVFGSTEISVTGDGRNYVAEVNGVTNSFEDGFLFSVAGDNSDNYSRARPIGGNQWSIQVRDNSQEIGSTDTDPISLLYIPRSASGLIGGVVDGGFDGPSPMQQSFGDFSIERESDGLWRVSIPGQDVTSGALIIENFDLTVDQPRNTYFSYDDAGDGTGDILIRQFAWDSDTETRLNTDFVFFFVPFENTLSPTSDLSVVEASLGDGAGNAGVSAKGLPLSLNADGTINYQTAGAIAALGGGQTDTDSFVYRATDGTVESTEATVTINWVGVNDAPEVISQPADLVVDEDAPATTIDLTTVFSDVDTGDTLTYTVDTGQSGLVAGVISGTDALITPNPDQFGYTTFTLTVTDAAGESASVTVGATVLQTEDGVVAVDDSGVVTDKVTPLDVNVLRNDFHPDTSRFSVSAAEIFGNVNASGNGDTIWNVVNTMAAPNDLTIQSDPNLGDVAVGRNGLDLSLSDGVMLGTVRDNTSPFSTVNTYTALGSYGFATDTGVGGGERNTPLNAAFFPFAEGWTSGHIAADGTLQGGIGVGQSDIVKLGTGLFEITIPEATNATFDGMLFVMGGNNDDNIVSVYPSFTDNTWLVRQLDSDSTPDATAAAGEFGYEDDAISFVYIPGSTVDLIGGSAIGVGGEQGTTYFLDQSYGSPVVTSTNDNAAIVSIPGYTSAEGVLIAQATGFSQDGSEVVPQSVATLATPEGNDFRIDLLQSGDYSAITTGQAFQFIFLPYDSPLERIDGLDFGISGFDATSARGATISLNSDGTINYDPSTANATIADLDNGESVEDTFTYTIQDGRGAVSTATVTVTVQGENVPPTAADDVVNLNELSAQDVNLTVLRNDVDPDVESLLGTPGGIPAANLAVDGSSNWTVAQTGTGANAITLGASATGDVEVLRDGNPIDLDQGVVIATIRENFEGDNTSARLVQAYENGTGGTSLAVESFGVDGDADANVSVAYFAFADNWVAGHVDASGALTAGNGLTTSEITKTAAGRYEIAIPGVADASQDGYLFVIGKGDADNVASARAVPGSNLFEVGIRDNTQDFGDGEDAAFSFVFVPRNAQNLVAGTIDSSIVGPNAVTRAIGDFEIERIDVDGVGVEYKVTIAGQTPDTGMLVLTNQDDGEIEDNFLSYESDGSGSFIIRSYDMPGLGRQNQPFSFTFVPFDVANQPVARPVPGLLSIESVDATSGLGATLTINSDGTINYNAGSVLDALYDGDTATDTFSYTMTDGFGGTSSATVTINVDGFGAAPVIDVTSDATYYGIGDQPVGIAGLLDIIPVGVPFFDGAVATFELTAGQIASDVLGVRSSGLVSVSGSDISYDGSVVGTFTGGSGTMPLAVTFNAAATEEAAEAVLRSVTFFNDDSILTGGVRQVTVSFTDGNGVTGDPVTKGLELGLIFRRELQQGVDRGYGVYNGTQDAQIRESAPDSVLPPGQDHLVDFDGGGNASQALLQFDIFGTEPGQIPVGSTITSARLVVETNPNTSNSPGDGATLHRMVIPWDAETATWNTFGVSGVVANGSQAAATFESQIGTASGAGSTGTGFLSFSVLPDVLAWNAGETNNGWLLQGWDGNTDGWFFSTAEDETPTARPRLEIEWQPAGTQTVSFRQGADGYSSTIDTQIVSGDPDADFSVAETLFIDSATSKGLLRFDDIIGEAAGQIPAGARVVTARLRTASTTSNAQGDGARFYPMLTSWTDTDTFNTLNNGVEPDGVEAASTFTAAAGDPSLNPNVQGGFHDWDVTADVQAWVNGDLDNNGWLFNFWDDGTDGWGFQSSDAAVEGERPRLEVVFTTAVDPEIAVAGLNDTEIVDGETTPTAAAGTDFGDVDVDGGSVTRTFTVTNSGAAALNLTGAQITGPNAAAFSFANLPVATVIPGGSFTFDVTFDPTEGGLNEATIELSTSDPDENPFDFAIVGNGLAATAPQVDSVVINDGGDSRSQITSVSVTFDTEVDQAALQTAFTLTNSDTSTQVANLIVNTINANGKTTAVLTFGSGASVVDRAGTGALGNSLADGNYRLDILAAQVQAGGSSMAADVVFGGQNAAATNNDDFFRLYGDASGDGVTNFTDLDNFFAPGFFATEGSASYDATLDGNGDGVINFEDLDNDFAPNFFKARS